MYKTLAVAVVAATFACSAQAFDIWKDYTVSKEVLNVTFVKVKPNRIDDYLAGLKQTWASGCEIGKNMGTLTGCGIYVSETASNRDFNVILVMKRSSAGVTDPDEARYNKVMAEMRAKLAEDKQDQIVESYEEIRSFFGEQDFREVTFK
jgi:hypothetical protein